ncbi:hypothetical protein Tco_0848190 [Tanacetum coccineum]
MVGGGGEAYSAQLLQESPTPPRDEPKGKGIDTEEPLKDTMPFMEEGGSVPKMPKTKSFTTSVGPLSQKEFNAQIKEMKRLKTLLGVHDELLEVHALASKKMWEYQMICICRVQREEKFQWVIDQEKKLGLPPPPALATFEMTVEEKKKKTEITENITVDGMQRNLIPPLGSCQSRALSSINLSQESSS